LHGNTADTRGGNTTLHHDVTLITPECSPRVLDNPVVISVTNNKDTVVELGTAWARENTAPVGLEVHLVSLNGNRDGTLGDGGGKLVLVVLGDILVTGDGDDVLGLLLLVAGTVLGSVWVVLLSVETTVLDNVLEGVVHETTVATHVAEGAGAVNELLLREGDELAGGDGVGTLDGTGGGERPAGTALALVLDWGDGTLGSPVDRGSGLGGEENLVALTLGHGGGKVELLEFSRGEISELVDAKSVGVKTTGSLVVVLVDVSNVVSIDLHAVGLLLSGVGLLESLLELRELHGGSHGDDGGKDDDDLHDYPSLC
jgi:hypothetical protein